jgi:hypothetical protein
MILLGLLIVVLIATVFVGVWAEPAHFPPERDLRDFDLRRKR